MKEPITTEYTKNLSKFIAGLKYEDLTPERIELIKKLTLHVVGVTLMGRTLPTAVAARATARATVGTTSPEMATLWGDAGKIPMNGALMANATAADTLDWEDCSFTGHPSAHLIPVSMAMAEAKHLSGKDYLTAIVGGFEVYQRVACYIQPAKGFDNAKYGFGLGSWQIWAGACCAGKILGCNEEQFNLLMGATGCSTPVVNAILASQGSDFYHLQYAITALTGVMVAGMVMGRFGDKAVGLEAPRHARQLERAERRVEPSLRGAQIQKRRHRHIAANSRRTIEIEHTPAS